MKESILYSIRCEECRRVDKTVEYWGETDIVGMESMCGKKMEGREIGTKLQKVLS